MRKRSKYIREKVKEEAWVLKKLDKAQIVVQALLYPCEDKDKVSLTLNNIIQGNIEELSAGEGYKILIIKKRGRDPIVRLFNHFRQRKVLATLRKYLMKYLNGDEIIMFLHKQAAYSGTLSLCEPGESPLGEIIVKIKIENAPKIIGWLTTF